MSDIIPEGILYGNLGVGSGTTNYNDLDNKPQINSVTLQGNKTASELGLVGTADIPVTSVNGETGAVVLDGTEIEFSTGVSLNEKILAVEQEIPVIAYPVTSVNGETGAVVLDGTEINYQAGKTINQKIDEVEAEIPVVSYPVTSVNGETGAVVLDGTDIEYSSGVSVNSQIDTLMQYIPVYGNTASGAIATFDTSLALPLQDCTIAINAVQESGTPTPSSPKAISGFTGANIYDKGKNLIKNTKAQVSTTNVTLGQTVNNTFETFLKKGTYTLSFTRVNSAPFGVFCRNTHDTANTTLILSTSLDTSVTFTVSDDDNYRFWVYYSSGVDVNDINNFMIEVGNQPTAYEEYSDTTTPITWQSEAGTVYGGSLDVTSGVLTVTHNGKLITDTSSILDASSGTVGFRARVEISSSLIPPADSQTGYDDQKSNVATYVGNAGSIGSNLGTNSFKTHTNGNIYFYLVGYNTLADLKTYAQDMITANTPITFVWKLATPVTYQLTPTQISAIVGTNNVFTDTNGDTSVVYACSLKDYIDSQ